MVGLLVSAGLLLAGWALAATAELIATVSLSFLAALPVGAQMAWFRFADMLYQFETQHPIAAGALYAGMESAIAYLFIEDHPTFGGFVLSFVMGAALFGAMVGAQWLIGKAYNAYMASALRLTVINGMNRMALQVRMGFDSTMELFGRPKPLAYIGGRPVYSIQGGALDQEPASVQALINMMNKRPGVTAEFASGDGLAYLEYVGAEGSHMLMEDGTSQIMLRKDVATRWTAMHEWMHRVLQSSRGGITPGEDQFIEDFLTRHARLLRIGGK